MQVRDPNVIRVDSGVTNANDRPTSDLGGSGGDNLLDIDWIEGGEGFDIIFSEKFGTVPQLHHHRPRCRLAANSYRDGNLIMGGAGADQIMGRGGFDVIDVDF